MSFKSLQYSNQIGKELLEIGKDDKDFLNWQQQWQARLNKNKKPFKDSFNLMKNNNPTIIPRNHKVEEVLKDAGNGNFLTVFNLVCALKKPYDTILKNSKYHSPPGPEGEDYKTFCGK